MNYFCSKFLAASAVLVFPFAVNAVERSEGEMPQELYKDYFVQLQINTLNFGRPVITSCAGTLIGGEYIVTAHHCVENPDDFTMKVIQGHDTSNPDAVYEGVGYELRNAHNPMNTCRTRELATEIYQNHVDGQYINDLGRDVVSVIDSADDPDTLPLCFDWAESTNEDFYFEFDYDVIILKLDQVIPHQDSAVLAKTFDSEGEELVIGEEVTFYGRGELADGTVPSVPQKATLTRESSRFWPFHNRVTDELDSMGDWLRVEEPCSTDPEIMNDVNYHCRFFSTWAEFYFNPTNSVTLGDSGSPFVHDGYVYGVISGYSNWNQENTHRRTRIISFSYLEEWLKEEIAGLAYPSKLVMDATQNTTLDITVQNFTNEVVMPDDYQGDVMTGLAITQACTAELAPFESCTVSLSVDAELLALEEDLEVYVPFTPSEQFVVTLQGPVETPDVVDPDEGDSESEESETDGTDTEESETDETDTEESETDGTDTEESETDETDTEGSENDGTDTEESETGDNGSEGSETDGTDTEESETGDNGSEGSESDNTDTGESQTDGTDTDESETDTGNPGNGGTDQETDESETDNTETDESETDGTETEETENEGSEDTEVTAPKSGKSGGSAGMFGLLAMFILFLARRRKV